MKITVVPIFPIRFYPILGLLMLWVGSYPAIAANDIEIIPKTGTFNIIKDSLSPKIQVLEKRQDLDEKLKANLINLYQLTEGNVSQTETNNKQAAEYKAAITAAPEKAKKLKKEIGLLQAKLAKQKPEDFNKISLAELEQRLIIEKENMISLDEQAKTQESDLALQNNRPQLIREQIVLAKQDIENTEKKMESSGIAGFSDLEKEAQLAYLHSQIDLRSAELKMLDAEAISNPSRIELLKAEQQLLGLQKAALIPVIQTIENRVSELRLQQAKEMQDALSQSEKELSGKHKLIQDITLENIQFSRDLQNVTAKIEQYTEQKTKIDVKSAEIDSDFKSAEKKISLAGLSPTLGKILREQRRNLSAYEQSLQSPDIQNETAFTSLEQLKVEDRIKNHLDIDSELKTLISTQVDPNIPVDQRMMIQAELRMLLNSQKEILNKLLVADTSYLRTLGDLDFAIQQIAEQAKKFAGYLDERLLWVPSSEPINKDFLTGLYHSGQWLLSPFNWIALSEDILRLTFKHLFFAVVTLFSLVLVWLCRSLAKQKLTAIAANVEKIYSDNFYYTLKALAYTLILILPIPLLLYFLGGVLNNNLQVSDFSKAIGQGLQSAAPPLFFIQFFYRLSTPKGIARKHFRWLPETAGLLSRQLAWLRFVSVPAVFIISSTGAAKASSYGDSLGRLALIILMLAMTVFLSRLLKPSTGLVKDYLHAHPDSWLSKFRYAWYSGILCAPLVIIGFAVAGYYLSALELQQKFIITLRLVFLVALLHELVMRWLSLVNRQLAINNARQKRKAAAANPDKATVSGIEEALPSHEEVLVDIPKTNAQTLTLLHVLLGISLIAGFWVTWKNILPAFSFLDHIVLWQHQVSNDHETSLQPITLTNLLLACLYVFISVVSVRNFSGVMELLVFRRFDIEPSGRYAVNQLAKYLLVSIGFIFVANELGGSWTQVQWLVTALSVGLGFGLQEIFANLVSGIILLFERPIRVGDTVTIGNVDGRVSRIQMRATTLIDFDQKELIVPNKTFITNQLVNWTLSDAITRVVIPIGVAYHSDVKLAHQVMLDTVKATPLVLAEPEPSVLFVGFGESSLDFSIRIFVSELGNRLRATHDLLMRLERAFREHHIEVPFPQREVHVRHSVEAGLDPSKAEETPINPIDGLG